MRVAILGSGFGLYCYLPAIAIGCRQQVLLPERYHERLRLRADVGNLSESVEWARSDEAMLERAQAVVISQRPADQVDRVYDCLRRENVGGLILEKPLAPDPVRALRLLEEIECSRKRFCIGYIFRYTEWGRALLDLARNIRGTIHIGWHFFAHHYAAEARNWKRLVPLGGGAIRFYGIHLIALLAEAGYDRVLASRIETNASDEAEVWQAVFAGAGLPDCHIDVHTKHERKSFTIQADHLSYRKKLNFALSDPLEVAEDGSGFDHRVAMLTELCDDFFRGRGLTSDSYRNSINLWRDVEDKTSADHPRIISRMKLKADFH